MVGHWTCIKPNNLYSPHTTFLRQSGHCYALSTALCSLLLGLGYNAFVVSGYATEDVTKKIMTRVDSPFPEKEETTEEKEEEQIVSKYVLRPPRDLRSKFLLAMEQRELDKMKAEEERIAEERRKLMEELEQPPFDELYGLRVHSWVLLLPGGRSVESPVFLEPSKGSNHPVDSPLYCGVESVWNNENYWVNMQDCRLGLGAIDYDFTNVNNWEHVLAGEPLETRKKQVTMEEYEEDAGPRDDSLDEKHLDMPISWSLKISIPHEVLKSRFPDGKKVTMYKRTKVEEFAEYVQYDGLVTKISRFDDMECEGDTSTIEEIYKNRQDCLDKILRDCETQKVTEYFRSGREDGMKVLIYNENELNAEDDVVIEFYHKARHDGLARLDLSAVHMTETYEDREDFFYYRHIDYAKRGCPPPGMIEGNRRIVVRVIEKFHRNEKIPASTDVAIREFAIIDREIHLQYHYDKGKVTASTRDFIKPPIAEMGESMRFNPELTCGYQAEIGAKPPRQLQLFKLFEKELSDEEKTMTHIREMEDEIADMLQQREVEKAFPKLQVSLYNREQNKENLQGMLERERRMKEHRVKEIEEDIDYLAPYAARQGIPEKTVMTVLQGRNAKERCMEDFKRLLIDRANNIQYQFEHLSKQLQDKQIWYITVQDSMKPEEEEAYFEELNRMIFFLHTLELRLARHRDLSPLRYEALRNYLYADNRLSALREQEYLAIGTQTEKNENKTRNNNAKNH